MKHHHPKHKPLALGCALALAGLAPLALAAPATAYWTLAGLGLVGFAARRKARGSPAGRRHPVA